ncbi:MFS transporter, partial [Arthrospira platensis SPKY1]|nr:MFS transporter [Arthrospira platensis SPKY1]
PRPHPELYLESIVAGVRYVRHAPLLRIVLQRMVGFVFPASGALALFAFIARREWEYGPGAFGLFMAAYGGGAVVAASFVPRLRRRLSLRGILAVATAVLHWRNFERVKQLDLDPADAESLPPEPGVESASGTLTPQSRVMVSITYRIASEDRAAFLAAMQPLGISRRRTGASGWELVESAELPGLFEERFRVASWEEHLRQHDRITRSDAMAFHQGPSSPPPEAKYW